MVISLDALRLFYFYGKHMSKVKRRLKKDPNGIYCECGCGWGVTEPRNKFILGHNRKGKPNSREARTKVSISRGNSGLLKEDRPEEIKYCKCGCNKLIPRNKWTGKYADYIRYHRGKFYHKELTKEKLRSLNLGKKQSKSTRRKISKSMLGKNNWSRGRKLSKETIDKMIKARMGYRHSESTKKKISISISGPNNFNWRGGSSCEPYCYEWSDELRQMIKERDNYKCQNPDCWKTAKRLGVHHIDYNKKQCSPSNLITLCTSCNVRANKDRDYWEKFYRNIMIKRSLI